jgi:HEPN domain-containing protein
MLKHRNVNLLLAILLAGGLSACDESSEILNPFSSPEGTELGLMVDDDLTDAILADAEAALAAVAAPAPAGPQAVPGLFAEPNEAAVGDARQLLEQARQKFTEAQRAWRNGDTEAAARLALEARLLVAEALVLVFGEDAYNDLLLRVDNQIAWLEEEVDGGPAELLARIRELRQEAVEIRAGGANPEAALIRATERLILALQIAHREHMRQRQVDMVRHARHALFMAAVADDLAHQVVGENPTERQAYVMRHARQLRIEAQRLFEADRIRLAFGLARESVNLSLVAVLLESAPDANKVEFMVLVSSEAIAAAETAIAELTSDTFLADLLDVAKALQNVGIEVSDIRPRLSIEILWHSAVTAWAVVLMAEATSTS